MRGARTRDQGELTQANPARPGFRRSAAAAPRPTRRAFLATLATGAAALVAGGGLSRGAPALAFGPNADGTLVDYASGQPIAGAEVRGLSNAGPAATVVRSDAQGRFRVALPDNATGIQIRHPDFRPATRSLQDFPAGTVIRVQRSGSDPATERALFAKPRQTYATGALPEGRGLVRINAAPLDKLACRVTLKKVDGSFVDLELNEYLRGVVPSEMPDSWGAGSNGGFEALKAQAVACRTYAARVQAIRGYLTADESDQVWQPIAYDTSDRAIQATGYEIMTASGEAVIGYYSSTCGGHSTDGEFSYLVGKRCNATANRMDLSTDQQALWFYSSPDIEAYCKIAGSRVYRWQAYWDRPTLETILDTYLPIVPEIYRSAPYNGGELGELTGLTALNRSIAGKIGTLRVQSTTGTWDINHEYWIRSLLRNTVVDGPQYSAQFALSVVKGGDGKVATINAYGGGWGHALGMCQYGAYGMAKAGRSYRDILNHYFPNTAYYQLGTCDVRTDVTPGDRYICRPGHLVKYTWNPTPGYNLYKVEVRNRTGAVVSVSAIVAGNTYTLPAPGPADEYTWYLFGISDTAETVLVQRKLITSDQLQRYHLPAALNGSNW